VAYVPAGDYMVVYAFVSGKRVEVETSHKEHRKRLRKRFDQDGLKGFHNYEVVELLLTLAHAQGDCKDMGKAAIKKFGSVRGVLDASIDDLLDVPGIGPLSAFTLKLVRAVAEYYYQERMNQDTASLGNSQAVVDYLRVSMGSLSRESFSAVFLDAQNRPIAVETLFQGTLTSSAVYPREVFKQVLEHNAASVIFAHNHPSGCVEPSENDIQITSDLVLAASFMDVRILDHIIVGKDTHFSFADRGLLRECTERARSFHETRRGTL